MAPRALPSLSRRTAIFAVLGAWMAATPYLARAFGLGVDVAGRVEVVDHVVPGVVVLLGAAWLALLSRRSRAELGLAAQAAAGLCFLAGWWVTATHIPLLIEAARGHDPWGAAVFHSTAGPVVTIVSLWAILRR